MDFSEDATASIPATISSSVPNHPNELIPAAISSSVQNHPTEFPQSAIVAELASSPVSVPLSSTPNEDRAAKRRLAAAEQKRKYRASLSEEKKEEIRVKDAQRKNMQYSLQRIQRRVASTDFTQEHIPEVNIPKQNILLLLNLQNT